MSNPFEFFSSYSDSNRLTTYQKSLNKCYSSLQEIVYQLPKKYIISDKLMLEKPENLYSFKHPDEETPAYAIFLIQHKKYWISSPSDYGTIKMFDAGIVEIFSYNKNFNNIARIIAAQYYKKEAMYAFVLPRD
ncbi:MAG TPA: hypothetical protein VEC16_06970 [Alphaproteobacteria bacterium]|nr:hypothetical protein [Alphaproteobacteria bacterium]